MLRLNLLRYTLYKAAKPSSGSPKKRLIFMMALLLVSIFGFIAAGISFQAAPSMEMPATASPGPETGDITEPLPPAPVPVEIVNRVRRGDTIINVLQREGVDYSVAHRFFTDIKPVYNLRRIVAGQKYTLTLSADEKEIEQFRYEIDDNRYLEVTPSGAGFSGKLVVIPYQLERDMITGTISYSLFQTILDIGEKPELADILASLYEYDVDFNRDIRQGDSFAVMVEKKYLEGKFVTYGHVLAAEFINRGKQIRVIRYTGPDGNSAFYHPDGRSVRKMFLRCPLPFMRVTSRYGNRRHPVLGFSAKHNGVDFGAPRGTKVRASGSGTILKAGYTRTNGRYIFIRHPNRYVSQYLHLNGFARGIRRGVKVEQGQLIGYVGSTGLSTGPHLHYGLQKNGRYLNPLRLKSPAKNPVKKAYMDDFKRHVAGHFLVLSGSRLITLPTGLQNYLLEPSHNSRITISGAPNIKP